MSSVIGYYLIGLDYTDDIKNEVEGIEKDNYLKKNELNQYLEAYIKCKDTMRDFVVPPKKN